MINQWLILLSLLSDNSYNYFIYTYKHIKLTTSIIGLSVKFSQPQVTEFLDLLSNEKMVSKPYLRSWESFLMTIIGAGKNLARNSGADCW